MVYFTKKKNKTGFVGACQYGNIGDEILVFYVRLADGQLHPAVQIRRATRKELAKDLLEFRRARRKVSSSSRDLFGGNFPVGSWRWLACHSGLIRDLGSYHHHGKIRNIEFKSPCMRKILNFVN